MKWLGQVLAYLPFVALLGAFSVWPAYRVMEPTEAMVSLTFSHAGQRVGECRQLSQEEMNELPPNMRRPADCPRQRHPVVVRLTANDEVVFEDTLPPTGLWSDGKSNLYRRLKVHAGNYLLSVAMNDSGNPASMDLETKFSASIKPGQNLVIGFDSPNRRFYLMQASP